MQTAAIDRITQVKQLDYGVWAGQWEVRVNRDQYGVYPTKTEAEAVADDLEKDNRGGRLWN